MTFNDVAILSANEAESAGNVATAHEAESADVVAAAHEAESVGNISKVVAPKASSRRDRKLAALVEALLEKTLRAKI